MRPAALRQPVAPAVYRPQPIPRVLQRKSSTGAGKIRAAAPRQPVAPAVYRPVLNKMTQPGNISLLGRFPAVKTVVQRSFFQAGSYDYPKPFAGGFSVASALEATKPSAGEAGKLGRDAGRESKSGVEEGDVASYAVVQWLEQRGDGLTGDHQPSGAAIKEAIREALHKAMPHALTRAAAGNAYKKAVTVVVTDAWHKAESRTYGGRNTKEQIMKDASDLAVAAMKDWLKLAPEWEDEGWSEEELLEVWTALEKARKHFFKTGKMVIGRLGDGSMSDDDD